VDEKPGMFQSPVSALVAAIGVVCIFLGGMNLLTGRIIEGFVWVALAGVFFRESGNDDHDTSV